MAAWCTCFLNYIRQLSVALAISLKIMFGPGLSGFLQTVVPLYNYYTHAVKTRSISTYSA